MDTLIKNIGGVYAIRLVGTRAERAAQHGRMIAAMKPDERKQLALYPLAKKNQTLIAKSSRKMRGLAPVFGKFYDAFIFERFLRLPREYKSRLKRFIETSKLDEKTVWLALYQPDLLMVLASVANEATQSVLLSGMPGCTSGVFHEKNSFLFLRNLDYPAAGHWEKYPSVFYHEPSEADLLKFVSISSLGIHTPGLTGFNEAGIAFSLHAQFSKKTSIKGTPIFFLGEDILENARTLEEAIHRCKKFKPIGTWTINLSSFKEKRAVSIELAEGKIHVRNADRVSGGESIAHANGFQCEAFQKNELHFNGSFFEDVRSRKEALDRAKPTSVIEALDALSSHRDFQTGELRVFGNVVSGVATIQSVVMDFQNSALYVSKRDETPTPLGPFVKLPFRWSEFQQGFESEISSPSVHHEKSFLAALHSYYEAYKSWNNSHAKASELTHAHLITATEQYPADPHLWMQRGYFELMHGEPKVALRCFETASGLKMSPHHQAVSHYFRGACCDLIQDRTNAIQHYEAALQIEKLDPKLRKRAQIRLEKPFLRAYCQKIQPDLQFVEPLHYL